MSIGANASQTFVNSTQVAVIAVSRRCAAIRNGNVGTTAGNAIICGAHVIIIAVASRLAASGNRCVRTSAIHTRIIRAGVAVISANNLREFTAQKRVAIIRCARVAIVTDSWRILALVADTDFVSAKFSVGCAIEIRLAAIRDGGKQTGISEAFVNSAGIIVITIKGCEAATGNGRECT